LGISNTGRGIGAIPIYDVRIRMPNVNRVGISNVS
jgi:hypothetical protein